MDTPPSQGSVLSIGPLAASDYAILPCSCDDASLQQVPRFGQTINMVQRRLQPKLKLLPIVANLYQQTQNMDRQVLQNLRDQYSVFQTVIPKRISIREEMAARVPCTNIEMRELAAEILEVMK
jgi:chromosome partitioning protein